MHTLEKLQRGELKGIQRLQLRCGLTEFPRAIFDLADSLEILDLSGNQLSALPDDLPRLHKLRVIFCSDNAFTELPEVLGQCLQLSPAAKLLRRLQNEMQMLLYTHSVNEGRSLTINSFWVHGTGALPIDANKSAQQEPAVIHTLRQSALQQDLMGWLEAWQHVDAHVIAPMLARVAAGAPQRLVLCGEHEFHVYDSAAPSLWQRLRTRFAPTSLDTVLAVAPLKD